MTDNDDQKRARGISRTIKEMVHEVGGDRANQFRFQTWTSKIDKQKQALAYVEEWANSWPERRALGQGLVLYGGWGTGKTHLAFAAAGRIAFEHAVTAKWVNGRNLMSKARDLISDNGVERELIGPLISAELLMIDDPMPDRGCKLTNYQRDLMYLITDKRSNGLLPMIVTLNAHNRQDARERIGDAVWERIQCDAWLAHFDWRSYRQPAREL